CVLSKGSKGYARDYKSKIDTSSHFVASIQIPDADEQVLVRPQRQRPHVAHDRHLKARFDDKSRRCRELQPRRDVELGRAAARNRAPADSPAIAIVVSSLQANE